MRSVACPDYDWHKLQHDATRKRMEQLLIDLEAGELEAAGRFLEYLARWFRDHCSLTDRMMGSHVRNFERLHAAAAS